MKEKQNQTKVFDMADTPIKRSTFDLSFPNKMTVNFNKIYPTLFKKTMAGDSWTIKTSMFSRWLGMKAPTFSEYSIRENCAYVSCNQLWGGFQQFIAQGDDQAAQYLLPGTTSNFTSFPQPYFTTQDITRWFAKKLFTTWQGTYNGNALQWQTLCPTKLGARFFRLFVIPIVARPWKASQAWSYKSAVNTPLDFLNIQETPEIIFTYVVGSVDDSSFWNDCVNRNLAYEMPVYEGLGAGDQLGDLMASMSAWIHNFNNDFVFVPAGTNPLSLKDLADPSPTLIELPKFFHPISIDLDIRLALEDEYDPESDPDYYAGVAMYNSTKSAWEAFNYVRYIPKVVSILGGDDGVPTQLNVDSTSYSTLYPWVLCPTETMTSTSVYTALSKQELFNRTLGQRIILQLMGAGTLTDYLGKPYSQSLLRQPFAIMDYVLGYYDKVLTSRGSWKDPLEFGAGRSLGTYNEDSYKYEVGVVNDVKIAFMPYLAYHKIWNDYIRDNRYELRFLYADPYRSPFMQPLFGQGNNNRNGMYCQGALIGASALDGYDEYTGVILYNVANLNNTSYTLDDEEVQTKITPTAPFSIDGLIQLLTLRERRVVHDFFTMVTPTAQYGNEAVANVSSGAVSTVAMRMATRLQKFLERSNFVGSDYVKQTLAHWGVTPSHCQHCSTRYLGGKIMKPTISPVTQTSSNNDETNQVLGQQSAQMYCSGNFGKVHFETNEFGYVMQLVTIQNDFFTTDGQELDPIYALDYPYPIFGDLGPEALPLARVVQTDNTPNIKGVQTHPLSVFGYIPRYAQWKCSLAEIHGDFRKSLSYWVSKRQLDSDLFHGSFGYGKVGNVPQIGKAFLYENPDYNAFVYDGEEFDHALLDLDHQITVSRELPMLPTPNVL